MTYPRIRAGDDLNSNKYEVMKYGMFNLKLGILIGMLHLKIASSVPGKMIFRLPNRWDM